jgi:hypothetical protein
MRLADAIKQCIIGEYHAFRVRLRPENSLLNMTPLLTGCAANRAQELQSKVILIHLEVLLLDDETKMVKKDRCF